MGLLLGQVSKWRAQRADGGAHAARGFVGGATARCAPTSMRRKGFNAARGFVGGVATYRQCNSCPRVVSMPHAALWVVQRLRRRAQRGDRGVSMPHAAIPFRPHHRFAVPLPRSRRGGLVTRRFLVKSRNISFPRRCGGSGERSEPIGALMPHAALWLVQLRREHGCCRSTAVSIPHAALWVVQP